MKSKAQVVGTLRAHIDRVIMTIVAFWTSVLVAIGALGYWATYSLIKSNGKLQGSGSDVAGDILKNMRHDEAAIVGIWIIGIVVLFLGRQSIQRHIAARETSEGILRRSEERHRIFLDTLPHGVQENDVEGFITYSNRAHARMLDMTPDRIVGRNIREFLATREEAVSFKVYLEHLCRERPAPTPFEAKNRTASGRIIDVVVDWRYRFDEQGTLVGFICVITDVTEQKRADAEARESREALELALNGAEMGMWQVSLPTMTGTIDERAARILGYQKGDIPPTIEEWDRLTHPDDLPQLQESLFAHLEGRIPIFESEHRMRNSSGDWVWVHGRGRITNRNKDGAPVHVSGTILDITERKRVEDALRETEDRYRSLFENAMDGIFINQVDGTLIDANQSCLDMFGYQREELLGTSVLKLYANAADRMAALQELENKGAVKDYPLDLLKKDGTAIQCRLTATVRKDSHGRILGSQGVIRDVTESNMSARDLHPSGVPPSLPISGHQ